MGSETNQVATPGEDWVVLASFDSYYHAEHVLASLGRGFRENVRKGRTTALVVRANADGSLKLTESRVLTASDFASVLIRMSFSWMIGFMGVRSAFKGAKSGARAAHLREAHVGASEHQAHKILAEAGPDAAVVLVRSNDKDLQQTVGVGLGDRASASWIGSLTEFLGELDPGSDDDWVRAALDADR
jgi:hypothetical protein